MKTKNIIFAIATISLTTGLTCSCTEDDEHYDNNMFTRAENMTRNGPELREWINAGSGTETKWTSAQIDVSFYINWEPDYTSAAKASISYSGHTNRSSDLEYTDSLGIIRLLKRYKYVDCLINRKFAEYEEGAFEWNGIILFYQKANETISGISDGTYGPIEYELINLRYQVPETSITYRY